MKYVKIIANKHTSKEQYKYIYIYENKKFK